MFQKFLTGSTTFRHHGLGDGRNRGDASLYPQVISPFAEVNNTCIGRGATKHALTERLLTKRSNSYSPER